jgi:hypothetical protein
MMFPVRRLTRARWLNSAAGVLLVLLQRTPVVRGLAVAESVLATPAGALLRALVPVAALGAVNSMAGASTQLAYSNVTAKPTVGSPFSAGIIITGTGVSYAQSWTVSNTLPPGVAAVGATLSGGQWVINPSGGTLVLAGTPTQAGTYSVAVSGYQYANFGKPVTSATATIVVAPAANAAPSITSVPNPVTALTGGTVTLAFGYAGTPAPAFQWFKDGTAISGATSASLVLANLSFADAGAYAIKLTNSLGEVTSPAVVLTVAQAPVAPALVTAPVAQTVTAGDSVQFSVVVTGTPTPTFQWLKDGSGIDGALGATLTLANVQSGDAAAYAVTISNAMGTITSPAAQLTVNPAAAAPVFAAPPVSETVATGATAVFTAPALGAPAPTYSWLLNGAAVPGATSATLLIPHATAADAGSYVAVAQNSLGVATSSKAALVVANTHNPGRLTNLSVITDLSPAVPSFTMGTVVGGAGTAGAKPLVVRAAGPALAAFGVAAPLADPTLELLAGPAVVASNDNWDGLPSLQAAMARVGAFAYPAANSLDAAVAPTDLAPGDYTVRVGSAVPGASGTVIAEIYDATAPDAFSASTPRLINVSVLKQINAGGSLTLGFTIGGATAKTVIIRAIGPGLGAFGVTGTLADPQLTLFDGTSAAIASNNDWGGDAPLALANNTVHAFAITDTASKDAMLLRTLPAGGYTATVTGIGGTGGFVIVEVYEVP